MLRSARVAQRFCSSSISKRSSCVNITIKLPTFGNRCSFNLLHNWWERNTFVRGSTMSKSINKIVLAYSGGLDTSAMLLWLKETYGCEVVCYCADVGQGEELSGLDEKAKATGASKLYVEDLREEFVRGYVWPAVEA